MSGGRWEYLQHRLNARADYSLSDVWTFLGAIEHELDWGICCDTCYECAKIRTISALEAYFDTEATSIENALRLLRSGEPECVKCKEWAAKQEEPRTPAPRESITAKLLHDGKMYKGVLYEEVAP